MPQSNLEGMKLIAEFTAELIAAVERRSEPPPAPSYFELMARDRSTELNSYFELITRHRPEQWLTR